MGAMLYARPTESIAGMDHLDPAKVPRTRPDSPYACIRAA